MTIQDRVRLLTEGGEGIEDAALLAVVAGISRAEAEAALARGWEYLRRHEPQTVRRWWGREGAGRWLAVVELRRRLLFSRLLRQRIRLDDRRRVVKYDPKRFALALSATVVDAHETGGVIAFAGSGRVLEVREIYRGTTCLMGFEARGFLRPVLAVGAAALLVWHTHPSGSPEPSIEDLQMTRRLDVAAQACGLVLVDSLVITSGPYVSLKRHGEVRGGAW